MKSIKHLLAAVCVASLVLAAGCGKSSTPPKDIAVAKTTAAKPAETTPAAPKPAEPAKAETSSDLDDLAPATITRGADIGTDPAKPEMPAKAAPASPEAPATAAAASTEAASAGKFTIAPNDDSDILWVGYGGIMGQMNGGFTLYDGIATLASADIASAQIELNIDMKSIYSNSKPLTNKLRGEEFFSTDKFTTAKFTSTGVVKDGDKYNVSGNLDILGASRNTTFPATIEMKDGKLHAAAEFLINRNDWGIVYKGTGDNFIKDEVLVKFDILCDPAK